MEALTVDAQPKDGLGRKTFEEVVLNDGRFARMTRPTVWQVATAVTVCKNLGHDSLLLAALFAVCGTIDDERVLLQTLVDMDAADFEPISAMVGRIYNTKPGGNQSDNNPTQSGN